MKIQFPKNIQQIGESPSDKRVYLEDYVATFLEQVYRHESGAGRTVSLYGRKEQADNMNCYFVYGAVLQEDTTEPEEQKNVFPAYQIIGEAYICREGEEPQRRLQEYGAGTEDRLLFLVGSEGNNLAVFLSKQEPVLLGGYYIFYEKNEMMQNILLEWYRESSKKKEVPDKDYAVREFRERYDGHREDLQRQKMMTVLYGVSLLLLMLCCITGISMMNQYDKMLQMEASIEHLALALQERELPETQTVLSDMVETAVLQEKSKEESMRQPEQSLQENDAQKETENSRLQETEQNIESETATVEPASEEIIYIVKQGDTLAAISKAYYGTIVKVQEICEKNQIEEPDNIFVGQKILLP